MADSFFLKNPRRIMALVMGIGMALWVYALAEPELGVEKCYQDTG